ncbi:MAG: DAK2 domain-containing protein [Chloroflexi bacterium]|nr:DAK2 domain-containing protein [Chloroflexota bacterium]
MAMAGLQWLESHYQRVNELNVFPVPDGDTGTNMLLTMRNATKEVAEMEPRGAGNTAAQMAHGAMMGSRGNSGTILSQLWIGFARTLGEAETFDASLMVEAMRQATETAYRGVQRAVEGTILTVAREMTEEAEELVPTISDLRELLTRIVDRGWDTVRRTPEMLPVLKEAGVVDSGGTGLMYILEGMLRHINGEPVTTGALYAEASELAPEYEGGQLQHPGENFYDVQFVIKGPNLNSAAIKSAMESMGESAVVVATADAIKVHVHVNNPGVPLTYAANIGQLSDLVVENMLEQYEAFVRQRQPQEPEDFTLRQVNPGDIATIAVAPGPGIAKVFQELGVSGLVNGGQTNNPSVEEFLTAIQAVDTDKIILLPNNKNIVLTAQQVATLVEDRQVLVIPTRTVPEGVSAMVAYQPDGDFDAVIQAMSLSRDEVVTGEVTTATRSVELDGIKVTEGQIIGLLEGTLCAVGDSLPHVAASLLQEAELDEMELVTLYYGSDIDAPAAEALAMSLAEEYPELEFEVVYGGQPYYPYILSIE